jgi:hypothetical protein
MWEVIYHEMLAISNIIGELSGIRSSLLEEHVIRKAVIETGEQKVQAITTTILRNKNPFNQFLTVVSYTIFLPKKLCLMISETRCFQ